MHVVVQVSYTNNIMTKEQKILLLFVLLIAGSGAAVYVTQKSADSIEQPVVQVQQTQETINTTATNTVGNTPTMPDNGAASVSATVIKPTTTTPTPTKPVVAQNKTITETLSYQVPDNHQEEITVTAVVDAQGNIVDVAFAYSTPTNRESREHLQRFNAAFSDTSLVGTKPGAVKLSRVGGGSLTTGAFNRAMQAIAEKI